MDDAALRAHIEIERLVHRYADAVVHRNGTQWRSTWAPDAVWDVAYGRRAEGIDAIVELWYASMEKFVATIQTVLNGTTTLADDGEHATGRWYIQSHDFRDDGRRTLLLAHYDDEYRRVDGEWRFTRRAIEQHYNGSPALTDDFRCTAEALRARGVPGSDA